MAGGWDPKDPDEVLDYQMDWTVRLGEDTIASSTWEVPEGITKDSDTNAAKTTTIWLSGGADGTSYTFTNHVVTTGGRTMDQSIKLKVKNK